MKVKICGITSYEDAAAALEMGADILGFNFYPPSPRFVTPEQATEIICRLPAFMEVAGVFVNSPFDEIRETIDRCQLSWIQLHGDESPGFCRSFQSVNVKTMKAIRVRDQDSIKRAESYFTDAILLDAFRPDKYGGTGLTFDWNIIGHMGKRVFLAGGINPDNVVGAVGLGVYGVDVCSGIESEPGKKDHKKMRLLFENIGQVRA
ncbi:MAG: phosphoribosylanthranilate isomerase [Phycisphaerales bacterium]|nr:MAG: phosphoribosylanthranilate isomerase [Phycisphaerales bacterium]